MARIVVIDDETDVREVLGSILSEAGYEVALAADGAEGIRLCVENPPEAVLTDIYMPNREGFETIQEIRWRFPAVPVVAMSGRADKDNVLSIAKKLGAAGVLEKPCLHQEVLSVMQRVMRERTRGVSAA